MACMSSGFLTATAYTSSPSATSSSPCSPSSLSFPCSPSCCLSKYLQRQQTVATATATAAATAVCAAQRINSQDEFSFRYFRLSPSVSVCVCWCVCALLMLFRHFQLFVCTTYGRKMLPQRTHVSVAPDIPDQLSCSPVALLPLYICSALLVCKSLWSRNGSSINIIHQAYPRNAFIRRLNLCEYLFPLSQLQFSENYSRRVSSSAAEVIDCRVRMQNNRNDFQVQRID